MESITPRTVDDMLSKRVMDLAKYLLPNGKKVGDFWQVGSVDGEVGSSCKVYLNGKGYNDFAGVEGGDYLNLWMEVKGLTFIEAFTEAKSWLGVYEEERKKTYQKPSKPRTTKSIRQDDVRKYINLRKITDETIEAFCVTKCQLYGQEAVLFPYLVNKELVHYKQRLLSPIEGKQSYLPSKDTEACLFGWQALPKGRHNSIIICEGEYDAMAWLEYEYHALSVPFGGGDKGKQNWVQNEYLRLSQFDTIYLSMDMDQQGELATDELIQRLGIDRCKIVKLPHKDCNDCLMAGVTKEEIDQCINTAKYKSLATLKSPLAFHDETLDWIFPDVEQEQARGFDTPWSSINSDWRPMWGELTLINGINAHGKSEFANLIALDCAMRQGLTAFVASMEIPNKRLNERFIKQLSARAKPSRELASKCLHELDEKLWIGDFKESIKKEKLLEAMHYAYKRYGVKVFLIDSLMKCGVDEEDNAALKKFVEELCVFKNEYMAHILLVVHPRKGVNEDSCPNKMDVLGTGGVTNLADNLITVWRNKKYEQQRYKINQKREEIERNGDWDVIYRQAFEAVEQAKKQKIDPNLSDIEKFVLKSQDYLDHTGPVIAWLQKHRNGGNERQFWLDYRNNQHINFKGVNKNYVELGGAS